MNPRYARQVILPEIGPAGQQRLGEGTVLCIGAGGLGCAVLPYLAAAGVGRIVILDDDRVDASNLQRQVLYRETDIGRPKAEAAAERLCALNGEIEIEGRNERLNGGNVEALFRRCDVVVDGSDNYSTKYLASDAAIKYGVPLIYASATGMEAMVTVFEPGDGPCLRCLFPEPPTAWVPNCAEAGVLGPLVGAAGCVQAVEVIKQLAGGEDTSALASLAGWLWLMDARDLSTRRLAIRRRPDCRTCSIPPQAIELPAVAPALREISRDEAEALSDVVWIDVREPDEYAAGHIPGAMNLPLSRLRRGDCRPPSARSMVLYCASGLRCRSAGEILRRQARLEPLILRGGYDAWVSSASEAVRE